MIKEFEKRIISSLVLIPISIFFITQGSIFFISFLSLLFLATSYEGIKMSEKNNLLKFLDPLILLLLILFISLTSQIGDLIISFFKRKAKIKDTGKILPGHGGLLDRIDGLIFAIPISYLFIIL